LKQLNKQKLVLQLQQRAKKLGFDQFGIVKPDRSSDNYIQLKHALKNGFHGDMAWLEDRPKRRASPKELWPDVKSIIMLGLNYTPKENPLELLKRKSKGNISAYARNRDYHDIIKGRLKELAGILANKDGAEVKVFVDTAPVMEKPLAQGAGIGWQGKHSVLVSRESGSWLFLGAIFTNIELIYSEPEKQKCGTCIKCLTICPTNAFPKAFVLDASKCLAYYNNEHKSHIPLEFRAPMGNRIFGCDDCLAICPWNKFAKVTSEIKLQQRAELAAPDLRELLALNDAAFRKFFSGSPIKRLGHSRFIRNVLIAVGNSEDKSLIKAVKQHLSDEQPLIRAMAIWALSQLVAKQEFLSEKTHFLPNEQDLQVAKEWEII